MVVGEFTTEVQVAVIGGGPGGYTAAIRAAQLGLNVVLIEKNHLGGTCLNEGCIPSKSLLTSADDYASLHDLSYKGITVEQPNVDFSKMQQWKQENVIEKLRNGVASLCKLNKIEIAYGKATFIDHNTVRVQGEYKAQRYQFESAIIATGSSSIEIAQLPFDGDLIISSKEALELEEIPEKLAVVGGGYIGVEIATIYSKLGSEVILFEEQSNILSQFDRRITQIIRKRLLENNVEIFTSSKIEKINRTENGLGQIIANVKGKEANFEANKILVSVGRKPNVIDSCLDELSLTVDEKGFIETNEKCQTNVPHIYAIGDVSGEPMLAHKAIYEGKVAAEVIAGKSVAKDAQCIPFVVFTDPEIATVGMTEEQAEAAGYTVITGNCPFSANGRALSLREQDGFIKVVVDEESHILLGVQMVGPEVSNLISEAALAIEIGTRVEDIALTIYPHPTLSEVFQEAAENALKQAIHLVNK